MYIQQQQQQKIQSIYTGQRWHCVRLVVVEESSQLEANICHRTILTDHLETLATQRVPHPNRAVVAARRQRRIVERHRQTVYLFAFFLFRNKFKKKISSNEPSKN